MFTLSYVEAGAARTFTVPPGETLIGRAHACDLAINADSVSRQHARLRLDAGRLYVRDAGSTYGTLRNGMRLDAEVELFDGDELNLGDVLLQVREAPSGDVSFSEDAAALSAAGTIFRPIDASVLLGSAAPPTSADPARLVALLSEIGKTLVAVRPLREVLTRIVDLVFESVPAECALLMLRDAASRELQAAVVRNRDGSASGHARLSRTVVNRVIEDRVAMLAFDASSDPRVAAAASIVSLRIQSFMCAPLWNRDEVIGVLYADSPRTRRFTAEDLDIFTALSNYAAVAIEQARLTEQLFEETRRRERLQRYHSPSVVNRIVGAAGGQDAEIAAQERDLSVMFADIVDFTAASERMPPRDIMTLLSAFFERMTDIIFEHEGTLDKFIGDCVMAVFGAPFAQPDHARRCVEAARAMRRALVGFNRDHGILPLELRIAINSGVAMMGDVGSPKRREFAVLGDVVNTASRLERVTKPGQILVSRATYEHLNGEVPARPLGPVVVRGRTSEVEVFEILD